MLKDSHKVEINTINYKFSFPQYFKRNICNQILFKKMYKL